ncbi:MAG TPA: aspartyl/asparaginyl beta-hydroxylase domain-containing protein [Steroidobacteraceae bacterium]|nr:aspartyl/asparaginyl beta-hydroxylase domain-containing protein [Steroidobacteraceae bacterium]
MLDIPGQPVLDKVALVGGCLRLPIRVDARRLQDDVAGLPDSFWGGQGGRVGVHRPAEAVFLRGYAPAEGERPIEDRRALAHLPYVREIIQRLIPAPPFRSLLARLPAGEVVGLHIDRAPYFSQTVRIHVPVQTHELAWMLASGRVYLMRPGEVWALNNSAAHGVWNAHPTLSRTHLICDFLPTAALLGLLERGDRELGSENPAIEAQVRAMATARA